MEAESPQTVAKNLGSVVCYILKLIQTNLFTLLKSHRVGNMLYRKIRNPLLKRASVCEGNLQPPSKED